MTPTPGGAPGTGPLGEAIRHEVLGEMAATLGRLSRDLGTALHRLEQARARLLEAGAGAAPPDEARWQRRHAQACEALWNVVIQRELCGLRRHEAFLREQGVPRSVRLHMGPASLAPPAPDPRAANPRPASTQDTMPR